MNQLALRETEDSVKRHVFMYLTATHTETDLEFRCIGRRAVELQ